MKRLIIASCVSFAVAVSSSEAASAQMVPRRDTTFEAALLDIVLAPVRAGTVSALRGDDRALLPVGPVLEILEVAYAVSADGVTTFTRPSDGMQIRVDRSTGSVQEGRTHRVPGGRFMVVRGEQTPLLDASLLATLLGVSMSVDWSELRVRVTNADSLPPLQRMRRVNRWAQVLAPQPRDPSTAAYRTLQRPLADGAMFDYLLSVPTQALRRNAVFSTALGASVLGGSLEAFAAGNVNAGPREVTGSWLGVWRANPWMTQLRLGDGLTSGPRARAVRGVTVGNTPFLRPLEYGTLPVSVRGDSAWEVESYVNGRLVRVDTLRGRDASIPMLARYGSNVIDRIAYGPLGEVRRTEQLLSLTADEILPAGALEYGVSVGECQFGRCAQTANIDLRAGLASRLSARVGVEGEVDSSRRVVAQPYVGATWLAPGAMTVSGSLLTRSEATASLRWQPTLQRGAVIAQSHRMRDVPFSDVVRGAAGDRTDASAFARLPWWDDAMLVSASWRDDRSALGATNRARIGVGLRTAFGQLYPYAEAHRRREPDAREARTRAYGLSLYSLPTRRLGSLAAGTWLSATAEWRDNAQRFVTGTVARSLGNHLRLDATVTAGAGSGPVFGLRFYGDIGVARLISSNTLSADSKATGSHQVQGSVYVDPRRGRMVLAHGPLLQRSGVRGQVYLDMNANGRLDREEMPLAGVVVRVGGVAAVTDSDGWFLTTDVLPFEPVLVQIETASLESPLWVATVERLMLEPAPNSARRVDIPILPGGVVEGQVTLAGAGAPAALAGVDVRLESVGTNRVMTVTTFSDGAFAFLGVAPGRYRIRLDSPLWAGAASDTFDVKPVANGDRIRGLLVRAMRRSP